MTPLLIIRGIRTSYGYHIYIYKHFKFDHVMIVRTLLLNASRIMIEAQLVVKKMTSSRDTSRSQLI